MRDFSQDSYYKRYLFTPHWRDFRQSVISFWGEKCCLCNNSGRDVHHRHYNSLGAEEISDCVLLCRDCHTKFHQEIITGAYVDSDTELIRLREAYESSRRDLEPVISAYTFLYQKNARAAGMKVFEYLNYWADTGGMPVCLANLFQHFVDRYKLLERELQNKLTELRR